MEEVEAVVFVYCFANLAEPLWSYLLFWPLAIAPMKISSLDWDDATCFVKHVLLIRGARYPVPETDSESKSGCLKMRKVGRCRSFTSQ